jgi:undecaprenyl diphosphate synthase
MAESERLSAGNTAMHVVFAFNYGGRAEIAEAARAIAEETAAGTLDPSTVDVSTVAERLYLPEMPDPELIIRTSGEQRLSNFLLWQSAYSELVFTPVLWPDFDRAALIECLVAYQARDRRFGGVVSTDEAGGH